MTSNASPSTLWLRVICFLACIPSGGSLVAKVYGLMELRTATLWLILPCCLGLVLVWGWAARSRREELATALAIGFWGGLLGTVAYDLARIPFLQMGMRVFAPISAYGVWIVDADSSSRFTELVGWLYHFSNGITIGLMYALFMRGRHWGWAIVWAFLMETIAVVCPFGRIFSLWGNYAAIGVAYLGHVAYAIPLGLMVRDPVRGLAWLGVPRAIKWIAVGALCAAALWTVVSSENASRDARAVRGEFTVEGDRLNPDWIKIRKGEEVQGFNPQSADASVVVKKGDLRILVTSGQKQPIVFSKTGVFQVFVETGGRTHSSFVIVEPVDKIE